MNLPVIQSHRYSIPTGIGYDPLAYSRYDRVAEDDYYSNPLRGMSGIGETDQQITAQVSSIVATAAAFVPVVGPLIGAAVQAAAAVAVAIEGLFAGCGQTCTAATNIVNQVGDQIASAMHAYMNSPVHTQTMQSAYLKMFDSAWALIQQNCGNPQLGTAGQRCVSDRQAGACVWKSSPGGWSQDASGKWAYTWAGAAGSGDTCWNFFVGMRDPVANDPTVVPDSSVILTPNGSGGYTAVPVNTTNTAGVTVTGTGTATSDTEIPLPLILGAAAIFLLLVMEG